MARIDRSALVKLKIVQEASRQFLENGYTTTTISKISMALGMSPGNLTYHYPSKEHLLAELVNRLCDFQWKMMEDEASEGISSIMAICLELASMASACEQDAVIREFFLSSYTSPLCLDIIRKNDTARAMKVFASHKPEWNREQFAEAELICSGVEYTSGDVTVKPDSTVSFTVTGENLDNLSMDNILDFSVWSGTFVTEAYGFEIDPEGKTAVWELRADQNNYFHESNRFEIQYSNDGGSTHINTGLYVTYDDAPEEITGPIYLYTKEAFDESNWAPDADILIRCSGNVIAERLADFFYVLNEVPAGSTGMEFVSSSGGITVWTVPDAGCNLFTLDGNTDESGSYTGTWSLWDGIIPQPEECEHVAAYPCTDGDCINGCGTYVGATEDHWVFYVCVDSYCQHGCGTLVKATADHINTDGNASCDVCHQELPRLIITKQPQNTEAAVGSRMAITVEAEGDGLTYQWYYKEGYMTEFKVSSNKSSAYAYSMQHYMNNRTVYCVITDRYGNQIQTDPVTIYVAK